MKEVIDVRLLERGKCGQCGKPVEPQYLWCDDCEDTMVRLSPTSPFWVAAEAAHG